MKASNSPDDQDQSLKHNYLTFKGAQVLWPPDCPDDMLEHAISRAIHYRDTCKVGMSTNSDGLVSKQDSRETNYAQVAEKLKKDMDQKYKPYWHVVCGKNFGCHAVHEARNFIFFTIESISYMLYKAG